MMLDMTRKLDVKFACHRMRASSGGDEERLHVVDKSPEEAVSWHSGNPAHVFCSVFLYVAVRSPASSARRRAVPLRCAAVDHDVRPDRSDREVSLRGARWV